MSAPSDASGLGPACRAGARTPISAPVADSRTLALATLGAMTSRVAHELRNVLGGVELYASLLAEQCAAAPELAPLSARLLAGVKQLGSVAGNILSVTRRPAIDATQVDVARVVTELIDSATLSIHGAGITLRTETRVPKAWVAGDAERLRQAFLNLLLNAIQAMPHGGTLTIGTRLAGHAVEVRVRDSGVGMDGATRARALEPFFTTRRNGTGLGLAVVREVAEVHGARLCIASRPGRGTTVCLVLPLIEPAVEYRDVPPRARRRRAPRSQELSAVAGGIQ